MAKVKSTKSKKVSTVKKHWLFVISILLICSGVGLYVFATRQTAPPAHSLDLPKEAETVESAAVGPSQGCNLVGENYFCDIKITNPKSDPLDWSSVITGLDGASITEGGYGTIAPNGSVVVQLSVPQAFCANNPEGQGNVLILEDKKSSNQAVTAFSCAPATSSDTQAE